MTVIVVTRVMPVGNGGKFTPEAKAIYSLVLEMQRVRLSLLPSLPLRLLSVLLLLGHRLGSVGSEHLRSLSNLLLQVLSTLPLLLLVKPQPLKMVCRLSACGCFLCLGRSLKRYVFFFFPTIV